MTKPPPPHLSVLLKRIASGVGRAGVELDNGQARMLARQGLDAARLYFQNTRRPRPSTVKSKLEAAANALCKANKAVAELGPDYILHLYAAADFGEPDLDAAEAHLAYLDHMARWTRSAASVASKLDEVTGDRAGGRQADQALRRLVRNLAHIYAEVMLAKPTHTIDPDSGVPVSPFDCYVAAVLWTCQPEGWVIQPSAVYEASLRAVTPPKRPPSKKTDLPIR